MKILTSYPLGKKELQHHTILAIVPTDCETCDQVLYYRNPSNTQCVIKKVTSTIDPKNPKSETIAITTMSLKERKKEKGQQKYIFPANVAKQFSKQCFDINKISNN